MAWEGCEVRAHMLRRLHYVNMRIINKLYAFPLSSSYWQNCYGDKKPLLRVKIYSAIHSSVVCFFLLRDCSFRRILSPSSVVLGVQSSAHLCQWRFGHGLSNFGEKASLGSPRNDPNVGISSGGFCSSNASSRSFL